MRPVASASVAAAALLLLAAHAADPVAAQDPSLDRVESLVVAGEYESARGTLGQWWSAVEESDVPGSDMARALMLRARLQSDPQAAEPDYLAVVLGYPTSPLAPQALLRLGQGLLATGEAARAAAYLDRLIADYPGRADRASTLLWLARANNAARRTRAACTAARAGLEDARDSHIAAMLRVEAGASCSIDGRGTRVARDEEREPIPAADPASTGDLAPTGDWAVQTGAFRNRATAEALVERLTESGHSPRLVRVPRNDLLRVRVGRFGSSREAAALVTRLRDQGYEAIVVSDAAQERRP